MVHHPTSLYAHCDVPLVVGGQVLAEKGGSQVEVVVAHPSFRLVATMNPGGDYGKKELSPALRNRFTELWVGSISDPADLLAIVRDRFQKKEMANDLAPLMLEFWQVRASWLAFVKWLVCGQRLFCAMVQMPWL